LKSNIPRERRFSRNFHCSLRFCPPCKQDVTSLWNRAIGNHFNVRACCKLKLALLTFTPPRSLPTVTFWSSCTCPHKNNLFQIQWTIWKKLCLRECYKKFMISIPDRPVDYTNQLLSSVWSRSCDSRQTSVVPWLLSCKQTPRMNKTHHWNWNCFFSSTSRVTNIL
jgi:hypothetical protein